MALASLATVADLPDAWQSSPKAERALGIASAAIRDAAESPISETTGTVTVTAPSGSLLRLGLIRAVTAVTVDGTTVTDYKFVHGSGLWRRQGWGCFSEVAVTGTFGLPVVPDDIVDLAAQFAVSWLRHDAEGGGSVAGLTAAAIEDARESYSDEAAGHVSPVFIPEVTRAWLRARFSGGVSVVETA